MQRGAIQRGLAPAATVLVALGLAACGSSNRSVGSIADVATTTAAPTSKAVTSQAVTTQAATTTARPVTCEDGSERARASDCPAVTRLPTTAPTTAPATATTQPPSTTTGTGRYDSGQYLVDESGASNTIRPGLYRVSGYYARMGADDEIIDNDIVSDDGVTLMQVQPTDAVIEISGAAVAFVLVPAVDPIAQGYSAGTYLVGPDIAPGRYNVAAAGRAAYAARLDANGEIIDNDLNEGNVIITIRPGDWAFSYNGTLTRLS